MKYLQGTYPVTEYRQLTDTVFALTVHAPDIAGLAQPGQFAHLLVPGFTLRRPISFSEIDRQAGTLRFVVLINGEGTRVLSAVRPGDTIDLIGPIGNRFLPGPGRNLYVGGGIGVAPLLGAMKETKGETVAILGFKSGKSSYLLEEFNAAATQCILVTEDGSAGEQGFPTAPLARMLQPGDTVHACGPTGLLSAVKDVCEKAGITCYLSIDSRMGCGVGACLVCTCKKAGGGYAHVCKDGPVFLSTEVTF